MIAAALLVTGFTACKNLEKDEAAQDANLFTAYVDSVESTLFIRANWKTIDMRGYQEEPERAKNCRTATEDKAKTTLSKA